MIQFKRKNIVTAVDEKIWTILWEYICWVLAGRPEGHTTKEKK